VSMTLCSFYMGGLYLIERRGLGGIDILLNAPPLWCVSFILIHRQAIVLRDSLKVDRRPLAAFTGKSKSSKSTPAPLLHRTARKSMGQ
jgi:hypothetical protein